MAHGITLDNYRAARAQWAADPHALDARILRHEAQTLRHYAGSCRLWKDRDPAPFFDAAQELEWMAMALEDYRDHGIALEDSYAL